MKTWLGVTGVVVTVSLAVYYAAESCIGAVNGNALALSENLVGYVVFLNLTVGLVLFTIRPREASVGGYI